MAMTAAERARAARARKKAARTSPEVTTARKNVVDIPPRGGVRVDAVVRSSGRNMSVQTSFHPSIESAHDHANALRSSHFRATTSDGRVIHFGRSNQDTAKFSDSPDPAYKADTGGQKVSAPHGFQVSEPSAVFKDEPPLSSHNTRTYGADKGWAGPDPHTLARATKTAQRTLDKATAEAQKAHEEINPVQQHPLVQMIAGQGVEKTRRFMRKTQGMGPTALQPQGRNAARRSDYPSGDPRRGQGSGAPRTPSGFGDLAPGVGVEPVGQRGMNDAMKSAANVVAADLADRPQSKLTGALKPRSRAGKPSVVPVYSRGSQIVAANMGMADAHKATPRQVDQIMRAAQTARFAASLGPGKKAKDAALISKADIDKGVEVEDRRTKAAQRLRGAKAGVAVAKENQRRGGYQTPTTDMNERGVEAQAKRLQGPVKTGSSEVAAPGTNTRLKYDKKAAKAQSKARELQESRPAWGSKKDSLESEKAAKRNAKTRDEIPTRPYAGKKRLTRAEFAMMKSEKKKNAAAQQKARTDPGEATTGAKRMETPVVRVTPEGEKVRAAQTPIATKARPSGRGGGQTKPASRVAPNEEVVRQRTMAAVGEVRDAPIMKEPKQKKGQPAPTSRIQSTGAVMVGGKQGERVEKKVKAHETYPDKPYVSRRPGQKSPGPLRSKREREVEAQDFRMRATPEPPKPSTNRKMAPETIDESDLTSMAQVAGSQQARRQRQFEGNMATQRAALRARARGR